MPGKVYKNNTMISSIKHQTLGNIKYAPFGDYDDVADELRRGCWRAREILNLTAGAFYKRDDDRLSQSQKDARDAFVADYLAQWKDFNRRSLDDEHEQPTVDEALDKFREYLDKYYFFGTMPDYRLAVHVYQAKDRSNDECLPLESWKDNKLTIPISNRREVFDLDEVLAVLLHEMVHIYLQRTVCKCDECTEGALLSVGAPDDQHGPIFQMLHRLIVSDLRRWHGHLELFDAKDCEGKAVSHYTMECHEVASKNSAAKWKYKYNYGAYTKHFIAMEKKSDVVTVRVRRQLRAAHELTEAKLRKAYEKKEKRNKDKDADSEQSDSETETDPDIESDVDSDDPITSGNKKDKGKGKVVIKKEPKTTTKGKNKKKKVRFEDQEDEAENGEPSGSKGESSKSNGNDANE